MKIIDIGICIDNNDPKGIGRIRCVRYSEYVAEKERAMKYKPFSRDDLFVVNPFLPVNINFIPDIGQAVKLMNYDTDKTTVNTEYIAGPFSNLADFDSQTFSNQIENTTYGAGNKEKKGVFDEEGNYRYQKSEGFFHKKEDYGLYGKKGSDIIFTENGIILRGGKTTNKDKLTPKERKKNKDMPLMSGNVPRLILKKFPTKLVPTSIQKEERDIHVSNIKTVIEYDLNSAINPTQINFIIQRITSTNAKYNSDVFDKDTIIELGDSVVLTNHTISTTTDGVSFDINNFLYDIYKGNDSVAIFGRDHVVEYPVYFKPSTNLLVNDTPIVRKVLTTVNFFGIGPSCGLIWSKESISPTVTVTSEEATVLTVDESSEESFANVIADKIYLLSTDTNSTEKNVDFAKLSNYELTHENLKNDIETNTYSMVRGENLIRFLRSLVDVVLTHEHNVVGPMVQNETYGKYVELIEHLKDIENDVLNKSLKIN